MAILLPREGPRYLHTAEGVCVGIKAGADTMSRWNAFCACLEQKANSSTVKPVT